MTISDYGCALCDYAYRGCGGLGVMMSFHGLQTVSCAQCQALHDVPVRLDGPGPRETQMAALVFACPVDASHPVRPWTDGESRWTLPGAVVRECPRCTWPMHLVRNVMEVD